MIKLGIFGDQSTNPELIEQIRTIPDTKIVGVNFSGNSKVPSGLKEFSGPDDLMEVSDAILILSDKSISIDLIKLILRKSRHLYLSAIPNLNVKEIKELLGFEKEAGIVAFIHNKFNYLPFLDPVKNKYEKPFLINLRTSFEGNVIKPSHEMLLLISALNCLAKSNSKKLEIFTMSDSCSQLTINLRIEYDNGSVINLTISQEKSLGYCEIFCPNLKSMIEIQDPLYVAYPQMNQEFIAIKNYLEYIQNKDRKENSFDNLMKGAQIMHEIREHLRFNGLDF
jgi:hypothetical protein